MEEDQLKEYGLDQAVFQGKEDQSYWVVGDSSECDIILAKCNISFGPSFAIIKHEGKMFIQDLCNLPLSYEPMIRLNKGVQF